MSNWPSKIAYQLILPTVDTEIALLISSLTHGIFGNLFSIKLLRFSSLDLLVFGYWGMELLFKCLSVIWISSLWIDEYFVHFFSIGLFIFLFRSSLLFWEINYLDYKIGTEVARHNRGCTENHSKWNCLTCDFGFDAVRFYKQPVKHQPEGQSNNSKVFQRAVAVVKN